jgi:adenine-specific DNA-methyltransferase
MWKTTLEGLERLRSQNRIVQAENSLRFVRYINDFPASPLTTIWDDLGLEVSPRRGSTSYRLV